jgi:integrase
VVVPENPQAIGQQFIEGDRRGGGVPPGLPPPPGDVVPGVKGLLMSDQDPSGPPGLDDDQVGDVAQGELLPALAPGQGAPPALEDLPLPHYPPERHPLLVFLRRLAPSRRRSQRSGLKTIARAISSGRLQPEEVPWHLLRYQHTAAIRDWLAQSQRPGTANAYLSALRGVLRECWRLGWTSTDDYLRAAELDPISGQSVARGRHIAGGELRALFEHLARDPRPIARRDAAALALLLGAGVRCSELAGLLRQDLDTESGRLLVRSKGRKERVAWLAPSGLPAVRDWLQVRGDQQGPLLNPVLKGGRIQDRALSAQAVYDLCRKLARLAATSAFAPHDLRRTWLGGLLEVTDLSTAQQLAGHARPKTTSGYDRRPEATRRRAAAQLHVPYVPPRAA